MSVKVIDYETCQHSLGCTNKVVSGKTRCVNHLHGQDPKKPLRKHKGSSYGTISSGTGKRKQAKDSDNTKDSNE